MVGNPSKRAPKGGGKGRFPLFAAVDLHFKIFSIVKKSELDLAKYLQKIVIIYFNVVITLNMKKSLILMKIRSVII